MQSNLVQVLFHRSLSKEVEQCLDATKVEPELQSEVESEAPELGNAKDSALRIKGVPSVQDTMPRTIRELLSDTRATEPRYVRLHNANYTHRELLSEILSMANRLIRRISEAQLSSADRRWWPVREVASKWDSIRAYPEMLQDADTELLKILVLDAYADMERLERA